MEVRFGRLGEREVTESSRILRGRLWAVGTTLPLRRGEELAGRGDTSDTPLTFLRVAITLTLRRGEELAETGDTSDAP